MCRLSSIGLAYLISGSGALHCTLCGYASCGHPALQDHIVHSKRNTFKEGFEWLLLYLTS